MIRLIKLLINWWVDEHRWYILDSPLMSTSTKPQQCAEEQSERTQHQNMRKLARWSILLQLKIIYIDTFDVQARAWVCLSEC